MLQDNDRNKLLRHPKFPSLQEQEKSAAGGFNGAEDRRRYLGSNCERQASNELEARKAADQEAKNCGRYSAMKSACETWMKRSKKSHEIFRAVSNTVKPLLFGRNFFQEKSVLYCNRSGSEVHYAAMTSS
jgi:hypothetical protein